MDLFVIVTVAVLGLVLLSIPVMIVVAARRETERRRSLQAFSTALGFTYSNRERLPAELRALPLFTSGTQGIGLSRRIKNVIRGRQSGLDVFLFDYWYTNVLPRSRIRSTKRCTVLCLRHDAKEAWTVTSEEGLEYLKAERVPEFLHDALRRTT
jgi:hypothetical protein